MSGKVGDNVFRASGVVAAAAAGRTGTVDWVTTPKVTGDSPITAVTGEGYFLNTTAGAITINLPAGAAGSIVSMADYASTWQTNNVTVAANGSEKIGGNEDDAIVDTEGQSLTFVYVDATQGWINTMDSTSNVRGAPPYIVATGGTITCSGDYKIHTFTGPGTFCVSKIATCAADNAVAYMIVAAGGAGGDGGTGEGGGGAGAGGFREGTTSPIVPYTASPIVNCAGVTVTASPYTITIGGGGTPGVVAGDPTPTPVGVNGDPSTGLGLTSAGGGWGTGGGAYSSMGGTGGSGGGGNARCGPGTPGNRTGQAGNTPPVSPAQGFAGGNGNNPPATGGGGGGATTVGGNATTSAGGVGGTGATTCISASPTAYAGGGGGGNQGASCPTGGAGGTGGGGRGGKNEVGVDGTVNTGGGGGGNSCGSNWPPTGNGGIGGSGIVIIRYRFQ